MLLKVGVGKNVFLVKREESDVYLVKLKLLWLVEPGICSASGCLDDLLRRRWFEELLHGDL